MTQLITQHLDLWTAAIKRRSSAGRGSSSKIELYGIKKLRELILELAVRGLLVPQDPKDEPASELLKKIAAEKAKLVKAGKIKKDKPIPSVGNDEAVFPSPSGWAWCRLDNVSLQSEAGWSPKCEEVPRIGNDWGVLKVSAVTWGAFNSAENKALPANLDPVPEYEVKPGDFLISRANTAELVARSVVVQDDAPAKLMMSDKIIRFKFSQQVCAQYLSLFNNSSGARRYYLQVAGGTSSSMKNVSRLQIQSLAVPLPPLAEQHRIVAKVDELMALCDQLEQQTDASLSAHQTLVETLLNALTSAPVRPELVEGQRALMVRQAHHSARTGFDAAWQRIAEHFDTLFTTEESIDQLKQTLLQLAVMGKLVPQDPKDESASELLKKIAAEKAKLVKEGKRKMLDRAKNSGAAYPYLRNTNVQWQRFDLDDIKEINLEPHELDEYRLRDGDLLICEGGEPGRCAIWRTEKSEMYFQKALHRVRAFGGVLPEYIAFCLRVDAQCGRLDQFFTGATIKHFAGQELNRYFFALPPLAEQHRIVAKVDELMALCDQLKSRLRAGDELCLKLAEAVTDAALNPPSENIIPFPDAAAQDARRHAIGCHVVAALKDQRSFGRTMLMKLIYLADAHVDAQLTMEVERAAAGPFDQWIYRFEEHAEAEGWFTHEDAQGERNKVRYLPQAGLVAQAAKVRELLDAGQLAELDRVLKLFVGLSTEEAEIIATLFAAWNDFLIDGHMPDDAEVIREVREHWTPEKQRFSADTLQKWLDWLRKHKLVPRGRGPRTVQQGQLFH